MLSILASWAVGARAEVTLEQIMAHPEWLGRAPEAPYWGDLGDAVFFRRALPTNVGVDPRDTELWRLDLGSGEQRVVTPEDTSDRSVAEGAFDRERKRKVFVRDGDVYWRDLVTGSVHQLTRTAVEESSPQFLLDDRAAYLLDGQPVAHDPDRGLVEQLFELRFEDHPREEREKEDREADALARQQPRLFDWIRDQRARAVAEEERERDERERDPARIAPPYFLGKDRVLASASLAPDGRYLLLTTRGKDAKPGRQDLMPRYVTGSGFVETEEVRVKVGNATPVPETLWLLDRETRRQIELDLSVLPGIADDPLADLRLEAEARKRARGATSSSEGNAKDAESESTDAAPEADEQERRAVVFEDLLWSDDGTVAAVQVYSLDNKDRWIATIDLANGALEPRHRMHDAAWINWEFRNLGFLPGRRELYFLSEETGTSQLHLLDPATGSRRQLTSGDFVVDSPQPSPDGRHLYYTANVRHPGHYDVFRVATEVAATEGGAIEVAAIEQLTDKGGLTDYRLSPEGDRLLLLHSTTTRPPELFLQPAAPTPSQAPRRLTETVSAAFLATSWVEPEIVQVPSSHVERPIFSRLYRPKDEPRAGGAAVIFVHGAGYLQNAHAGWSTYFREFLFHTLLVEQGYTVLDMDYRGSAGYGRDWRTAIYRHMGGPELEDLIDGVRYLVEEHGVDRERIGVYGGSYGGFLALMALFKQPGLFAAGAALRPVTDWAHYNHPYTSNILNTPELDPEAYERSSPIELAAGLADPLLIATGMLDDNVLFQDSVRLVQRLIELEKEDWEIAIYPVEAHGFLEPSSWLDEYRRILKLFQQHLAP